MPRVCKSQNVFPEVQETKSQEHPKLAPFYKNQEVLLRVLLEGWLGRWSATKIQGTRAFQNSRKQDRWNPTHLWKSCSIHHIPTLMESILIFTVGKDQNQLFVWGFFYERKRLVDCKSQIFQLDFYTQTQKNKRLLPDCRFLPWKAFWRFVEQTNSQSLL